MKLKFLGILLAALIVLASPAFALDLHQARASGAVGEKADGYVAARENTPEVQALVSDVNKRRRQEYLRISQENKQSVDIVAKLAAIEIIKGLEAGVYYQGSDGSWIKR